MLASLLIVFREVLEAGLIVGIVLAATEGIARRLRWIGGGVAVGVAGAGLLAVFAGALSNALSGNGQELFNAAILLLAVGMLGWHHLWMASHGRQLSGQLKTLGADIGAGRQTLLALAAVVALAILREGSEVVLFLFGVVASSHEGMPAIVAGGVAGLLMGAAAAFLLYRGLLAIPAKRLFMVTEVLLTLLAAGLAAQAFGILVSLGFVPSLGDQVWDTSWMLREDGILGRALHALIGYTDRPSGVQILAYVATLAVFWGAARLIGAPAAKATSKSAELAR